MKDDLISRQSAIDAVAEGLKRTFVEYRDVAEKMLNKVPSAQPRSGKWIKRKGALGYNCSCCGKSDISNHFDYCPNCGADMRGGQDGAV